MQSLAFDEEEEARTVMLFDPTRSWVHRGACREQPPGLFLTDSGTQLGRVPAPAAQAVWNEAKRVCARCPVLEECRRDTLGEPYGVWGGKDEYERWAERKKLPKVVAKWPAAKRRAWGKAVYELRENGVSWTRIREMTGLSEHLGLDLVEDWIEHKRALYERDRAPVVDLALPPAEPLSFPPVPGRGHAWVRHAGLVSSAVYRGQTADGKWMFMSFYAGGRHHSNVWVPAEDVQMHHPQPVQILEYVRRPDVDRSAVAKTA